MKRVRKRSFRFNCASSVDDYSTVQLRQMIEYEEFGENDGIFGKFVETDTEVTETGDDSSSTISISSSSSNFSSICYYKSTVQRNDSEISISPVKKTKIPVLKNNNNGSATKKNNMACKKRGQNSPQSKKGGNTPRNGKRMKKIFNSCAKLFKAFDTKRRKRINQNFVY